MLGKAMQLCSANFGVLNTYDGKAFHTAATYGLPPAYDEYRRRQPLEYGPGTGAARASCRASRSSKSPICSNPKPTATASRTAARWSISAARAACWPCRCSRTSAWSATS